MTILAFILAFTKEQEETFIHHVALDRLLSICTIMLLLMLIILSIVKAIKVNTLYTEVVALLTLVRQYTEFSESQKQSSRNELLSKIGQTVADNVHQAVQIHPEKIEITVPKPVNEGGL